MNIFKRIFSLQSLITYWNMRNETQLKVLLLLYSHKYVKVSFAHAIESNES